MTEKVPSHSTVTERKQEGKNMLLQVMVGIDVVWGVQSDNMHFTKLLAKPFNGIWDALHLFSHHSSPDHLHKRLW